MTARLIDGPATAPATVLLAHGAGAPMDSPFLETIAKGLAARGWRVVRFEFPYMARQRQQGRRAAPDRLPKLLEAFRAQLELEAGGPPLVLAGKSLGGRVATLLLAETSCSSFSAAAGSPRAALCFGYPFHPPGKPESLRTAHLQTLTRPTLIVQGERDSFGRRAEVEGYRLPQAIRLAWIPEADHSLRPTRRSGLDEAAALALAVAHADGFLRELVAGPYAPPSAEGP
ncbi:MAG: alpha/beta family hydrolase [Synechococcaceae cyanobacterium]|nr:alpha/beta family hydrolase [Synechococcaceae cyanobacterium]